uniref:BTB domain-containing protein n=1 Tax=Leersia perrieri TaxID=77586 RepID=A0A0D9XRP9_9ORYZ
MTFTVAGWKWQIRFYPNGHGEAAAAGFVSVYVGLAGDYRPGAKPVIANAMFTLLNRDGKPVPSYAHAMNGIDFSRNDFGTNIKRADLRAHLKDVGFVVRCDLCFDNVKPPPPQQQEEVKVKDNVKVPPSNLHRHLGDLLWKKQGCGDVSIDVQGMTFTAHRWMLAARSSIMAAELDLLSSSSSSDADDKARTTAPTTLTLSVDDDMEPKVFRALLHFIYTDVLPEMTKEEAAATATGLHVAVGRYEMERLKLICEDTLCKNVSVDTVASALMFAEKNGCRVLKAVCLDFLTCDKLE